MDFIDRAAIYRFHKARIADFGAGTTKALGWKSDEKQQARFEMLSRIGDMDDCSVLDAGCGHGDLKAFLDIKFKRLRYAGIDMIEEFLDVATERYGELPDTTFYLGDCRSGNLPNMDYVLCSGMLSYRNSEPDFIYTMIDKLFGCCKAAFGFNLLNRAGGITVAYEQDEILEYCSKIAPKVVLHNGYLDDDFTVFMYRDNSIVKEQ